MGNISNLDKGFFYPIGQLLNRIWSNGNNGYDFGWDTINASTQFNQLTKDKQRLAAVLSNPAALKVFALQCDLFSMGRVFVNKSKGKEEPIENDPFLSMINSPNLFQNESQFLWDFMFWLMIGTDYIYVDSKIVSDNNRMYHLDPSKIEWPYEIEKWKDKLILSEATLKDVMKLLITYRYDDGSTEKIPLGKVITTTDLSNGLGNWFRGGSRLDALYKVISNSEHTLDTENINIRYAGKFLIGGKHDATKGVTFGDDERKDLEAKIDKADRKVYAYKSDVQIRRFVENFANLQLDKIYANQYFTIGTMYGIPRDVLEAYNESSTFENQEKARAAHINYCFEPKGGQFMDAFERYFGYDKAGKNIFLDWSHMPFMQQFEKEKAEVSQLKIENLTALLNLGIDINQANRFLDLDFKITNPPKNEQTNTGGNQKDQSQQGSN